MRLTYHNQRHGKKGVFLPQHNDREKGIGDHVDRSRSEKNIYWTWDGGSSFEESEKRFYEENFQEYLKKRNRTYKKNRHRERMRTVDEYRKDKRTCPEEVIYQIGKTGDTVDGGTLWEIVGEVLKFQRKRFPLCQVLDVSLHMDESTPHVHVRQVWISHDRDGDLYVSQSGSLREMDISLPREGERETRYNNRKVVFTETMRKKLFEISKSRGLDLEEEPRERGRSGLDLVEYKCREEERKSQEAVREALEDVQKARRMSQELREEVGRYKSLLEKIKRYARREGVIDGVIEKMGGTIEKENRHTKIEKDIDILMNL